MLDSSYAYIFILPLLLLFTITVLLLTRLFMKCSIKMCKSQQCMEGKVIIVTGANTGIGLHAAKNIATRGGRVILACRNEERGIEARNKIFHETDNTKVEYKHLNLSSLDSVRKFAEDILKTEDRIDVLINNAGVHGFGDRYTADGIVEGMQINHFGPFLLTLLLLPLLKKTGGRIVNLTSIFQYSGVFDPDHVNKAGYYSGTSTYANGKLCNMLFTVELARRLKDSGVIVNAVHPGVIRTNITSKADLITRMMFEVWCWLCCRTAEQGAQTVIYLAVAKECADVTGKFFVDCKERFMTSKVYDQELINKFWQCSEKLVGYTCVE